MQTCTPHFWIPAPGRGRLGALWVEGAHVSAFLGRLTVRVWLRRDLWGWGSRLPGVLQAGPVEICWDGRD